MVNSFEPKKTDEQYWIDILTVRPLNNTSIISAKEIMWKATIFFCTMTILTTQMKLVATPRLAKTFALEKISTYINLWQNMFSNKK